MLTFSDSIAVCSIVCSGNIAIFYVDITVSLSTVVLNSRDR